VEALELKERIIAENKIEFILEELGMHHIKKHYDYYTCGMPSGDNKSSTVIYIDSLYVEAYTRDIVDKYGNSDIISLVSFIKGIYFTESIKWICDICEYDFYVAYEGIPRLLKWLKEIEVCTDKCNDEDEVELEPIDENNLKYFGRYVNPLFRKDGISNETMDEFELGYDLEYHMITIPIRDELGTLVGIKGRLFKEQLSEEEKAFKYFYIQPCAKSKILYGLNKTMPYIKRQNEVIVCESEKGVMQLWSAGIRNAVAIGGHQLSKVQVQKLTHLNVPVVIAFDQGIDINQETGLVDKSIYEREYNKFLPQQTIYCVYDNNILNPKESPMDNVEKNWRKLYNGRLKIR